MAAQEMCCKFDDWFCPRDRVGPAAGCLEHGSMLMNVWDPQSAGIFLTSMRLLGHAVLQSVEALCYKLEGRGLDSRRCHWNFSLT